MGFPVFVPRPFLQRMRFGDPTDPLLRQVLPVPDESEDVEGFSKDPVHDQVYERFPGVIQKYPGRALLVVNGACAIHCRYCFRRHYPYHDVPHSPASWRGALESLADDRSLTEIILSGGDPLTLVDSSLRQLVEQIANISHVRRIRIHTRLPVVIPSRVTNELIETLQIHPTSIVVVHINHPHEIDDAVVAALSRLVDAGVTLLNQAVLMRGVNDSADVLAELCLRLVDLRVSPYYLNQLDRVAGAAHFEVPIEEGKHIMQMLSSRLPGYALPRYVQDVPGQDAKQAIC